MFRVADKTIKYSFCLLFTFIPLILTPWNYELFEFNKMILTYLLTVIIVGAWLMKMVASKKLIFQRTPLDIGVLLFLFSQIASTILSIDRHTSFFGYYSRFNGGLLSTISYILLYYAFISNMSIRHTLFTIYYSLFTSALISAYGILEHFGIDKQYWVQDVQNRVFSTLGQPNWLSAYLVGLMPMIWAFALLNKRQQHKARNILNFKLLFYALHFALYTCLLFTKSRSGFLGFVSADFIFWTLTFYLSENRRNLLKSFFIFNFSFLILALAIGTPWTPSLGQIFQKPQKASVSLPSTQEETLPVDLITPSGEIRKIVWQGAIQIFRHHPFFGTGQETFAQSYYWYRPREHNDTSEWDFLYNKAHNEYLNYLACTGVAGLGSYLLIIAIFIISNFKFLISKKSPLSKQIPNPNDPMAKKLDIRHLNIAHSLEIRNSSLVISLLAGFAGIAVTNFFGFSVVITNLFFFLFPAMSFVLASKPQGVNKNLAYGENLVSRFARNSVTPPGCKPTYTLDIRQLLTITLILLLTVNCLLFTLRLWYSDFLFARGTKYLKADSLIQAYTYLQEAVDSSPSEPLFHNELSDAASIFALTLYIGDEATAAAQMVQLAIQESDEALKISPYHLNYLKTRTKMFYNLGQIDEKYYQEALKTLLRATDLAPTDPKITYNLGLLYYYLGQKNEAIKTMEKTLELKPNYDTARQKLEEWKEK